MTARQRGANRPPPAQLGTALGFRLTETGRRSAADWTDSSGRHCRGATFAYRFTTDRHRIGIRVRVDETADTAAVWLSDLIGDIPGSDQATERPIDVWTPAARVPGSWQAPLALRLPGADGRVRRRYLSSAVDLKGLGLTVVLAELEGRRVRLLLHEQVVARPARALRGRLVALVSNQRPDTLAVVYLATRLYPLLALGADPAPASGATPELRQAHRDRSGQRDAETRRQDQSQRRAD